MISYKQRAIVALHRAFIPIHALYDLSSLRVSTALSLIVRPASSDVLSYRAARHVVSLSQRSLLKTAFFLTKSLSINETATELCTLFTMSDDTDSPPEREIKVRQTGVAKSESKLALAGVVLVFGH